MRWVEEKMRKILKIIGIVFGIMIVISIIMNAGGKTSESANSPEIQKAPEKPKQGWRYRESEDGMDGSKRYFAEITSTNKILFQFPYEVRGGSSFDLTVRNMKNKNEVILTASKCQFNGETCRVKFDDAAPVNYSFAGTADYSSCFIFFNNSKKFIGSLKTANKLRIECGFFQEGNRIIEFDDVQGLEWNR
jgi:hypothetical protein